MSHFRPTVVPHAENVIHECLSTLVPLSHLSQLTKGKGLENSSSGGKEGKYRVDLGRWDICSKSLRSEVGRQWDESETDVGLGRNAPLGEGST